MSLILTRKPGESLYIGDSVKITVLEIKGNQIRLGIDAPRQLRIAREEIYLQIMEENKMASDISAADSLGPFTSGEQASSGSSEQAIGFSGNDSSLEANSQKKLVVKPVVPLNAVKGKFSGRNQSAEANFDSPKQGLGKSPEIIIRKKKKPSEEG